MNIFVSFFFYFYFLCFVYEETKGYNRIPIRWNRKIALQAIPLKKSEIREQQNWQRSIQSLYNLTDRIVQKLNLTNDPLSPINLPQHLSKAEGVLAKTKTVLFSADAFQSTKIKYVRRVFFSGDGYQVFNILVLPNDSVRLPILGIDIVVLPGEILASIDFQPIGNLSFPIMSALIERDALKLCKWERILPRGGDLPPGASKYFSPKAVWTRFPNYKPWANLHFIEQCADDFTNLYAESLSLSQQADTFQGHEIATRNFSIRNYLLYRIDNDPAKRMLVAAFGKNWTNTVLSSIVFPFSFDLLST